MLYLAEQRKKRKLVADVNDQNNKRLRELRTDLCESIVDNLLNEPFFVNKDVYFIFLFDSKAKTLNFLTFSTVSLN